MTEPSCRVIDDSLAPNGVDRLTTVEVKHHRFILAETNTHGAFAKSSASTRAIPLKKKDGRGTFDRYLDDPALPVEWNREQPGMQGGESLTGAALDSARALFDGVHTATSRLVSNYIDAHPVENRLHKSALGRLLEPMQWHTAIWTFDHHLLWNFLAQRDHPSAQPEFRLLAAALRRAVEESKPQQLKTGQFHLPFIRDEDWDDFSKFDEPVDSVKLKVSIARCARTSYMNHDGVRSVEDDLKMFNRTLRGQVPPHLGPAEHVARAAEWNKQNVDVTQLDGNVKTFQVPKIGKFYGFVTARHMGAL